jgi:tRNA A-37 threonylcarbamoyl transferase component Bud32/dienelactone hydrolase
MSDVFDRLKAALAERYAIERELGRGGMATVYLAHDLKHDRQVAVKVFHPELAAVVGAERFLNEIQVTARLSHPHILPLHDSGEADGFLYYVMPFIEGETLRDKLDRESLVSIDEALKIASEVADALDYAHRQNVVHRDIKPANILLHEGHALLADFGIARAVSVAGEDRLTGTGLAMGTPSYMSPEQAAGERDVDARSDVFALGCVVYEMLAGHPPHVGSTIQAVIAKLLSEVPTPLSELRATVPPSLAAAVHTALAKSPTDRISSVREFRLALEAAGQTLPPDTTLGRGVAQWMRRRMTLVLSGIAAGALVVVVAYYVLPTGERETWARTVGLPRLERLAAAEELEEAYALARELGSLVREPRLDSLWSAISTSVTIHSKPSEARVFRRAYAAPEGAWEPLGSTPLHVARFPLSPSVLRLELPGYRTTTIAGDPLEFGDTVVLHPEDSLPADASWIPGDLPDWVGGPEFAFRYASPNLSHAPTVRLRDFLLDRYEVTNQQFKEFVDAGGYEDNRYWTFPFVMDGRQLSHADAMVHFTDQTGRPGPSTWEFGEYPAGQGDFPVTGVSWYEATAYARFRGRDLPTVYHWFRAATTWRSDWILPLSNMEADAPGPVGAHAGLGQFGTFDMAGNAREWVFNASAGERLILGGGWEDSRYLFTVANAAPPFDRSPMNGFRLATYMGDTSDVALARRPIDRPSRDFTRERPVNDELFAVYRRMYAYDPTPLDALVERVDSTADWIRERVTFDAAYGGERMQLYLYTPRQGQPPFQTVVYFPASGALWITSFEQYPTEHVSLVTKSGRAFAFPVYQSTFDRDDGFVYRRQDETNTYREHVIHWAKDLGRTIDYLETRPDVDATKLAYLGFSWGGMVAPIMIVAEPRISTAILVVPGLSALPTQPEVDPFNFVTRASIPVLMLSGEYDMIHPLEASARPMYDLWGAPDADKRHVISRGGHFVPYLLQVRESLDWLDRYLGPVGKRSSAGRP